MRPPPPRGAEMLSVAAPGLGLDVAAEPTSTAAVAPVIEHTKKHRTASAYLSLQPSETAILHAASRIFAGFVASGVVTDENEKDLSDRSVRLATRMALVVEKYVQSDDEDW